MVYRFHRPSWCCCRPVPSLPGILPPQHHRNAGLTTCSSRCCCPADTPPAPVSAWAGVVHAEDDNALTAIPEETVLVARHGLPRHAKIINQLSAVITEKGSAAGHLASVAREFSVPMLVNAAGALDRLPPGKQVTVWADDRKVYDGVVEAMRDSPCARRNPMADSPFMRRLHFVMRFCGPPCGWWTPRPRPLSPRAAGPCTT